MIRHVGRLGMDQLESRNYIGYLARVQRHYQFSCCCWCFFVQFILPCTEFKYDNLFLSLYKTLLDMFFMPFIFPCVMKNFSFKFHVFPQGLYYHNIVTIIV